MCKRGSTPSGVLVRFVVSAFLVSYSTVGGGTQRTLTAEGTLKQPVYKYADFKARRYCTPCRVDFESDAPQEMPAGALSLEIAGVEPEGVLHVALRMHGVPDGLLSVKGSLEAVRENGLEGSGLPLRYRDYLPGDLFPLTSGKPPCYDVNGALTSLIRFVGATCGAEAAAPQNEDAALLTLSFDLLSPGDVRFRTTELLAEVREDDVSRRDTLKPVLYGGILHVRKAK